MRAVFSNDTRGPLTRVAHRDETGVRWVTGEVGVRRAAMNVCVFTLFFSGGAVALGPLCPRARAEPTVEISGATGFGAVIVGVTPGRFAVSPNASVSVRGERGFFFARDTLSLLGATGGRFGINNEATIGGGVFWELVNLSAGLSLVAFSLPICGPQHCGQMGGVVPGASIRLDVFGPYLSGALGVSLMRREVPSGLNRRHLGVRSFVGPGSASLI